MNPLSQQLLGDLGVDAADHASRIWSWFLGVPLRVILYVVVGLIALAVARWAIGSATARIAAGPTGGADGELASVLARANPLATARRAQRTRTVGSVLRSSATLLIGTIVVLLVLDALNINIAPFLASAGIVGVAIGFGAQSLVRDFLTGLFMLVEDQYGVGDVIDAGPATGRVEAVGLRVTRIRDADGTLWFVPNGSMTRVGNKTQQWATAALEVDLDYFTDPERARQVLVDAARSVSADPEVGPDLDGEPVVLGIERLSSDAITLRLQVRTSAARQWEIARRLRVAVRAGLIEAGIPLGGQRDLWAKAHPDAEAPSA